MAGVRCVIVAGTMNIRAHGQKARLITPGLLAVLRNINLLRAHQIDYN